MKVITSNASGASDGAILGPIDRVLGFGFGAVKGALIAVFGFTVLVIGFDGSWGYTGRPTWITTARTYASIDAAARSASFPPGWQDALRPNALIATRYLQQEQKL